jgi:hypothetical protein
VEQQIEEAIKPYQTSQPDLSQSDETPTLK